MKLFSRLFARNANANLNTLRERDRLSKSMPGQSAAVTAARLGILVH